MNFHEVECTSPTDQKLNAWLVNRSFMMLWDGTTPIYSAATL